MDNPRRLLIESDFLSPEDLDRSRYMVSALLEDEGKDFIPDVFDEVIDYAYHNPEKTLEAVLHADEIYASSSLYGLGGARNFVGSPAVFDRLIKYAREHLTEGKSVFFFSNAEDILWDNVHLPTFRFVFQFRNKFFTTDGKHGTFRQLDPKQYFKSLKAKTRG